LHLQDELKAELEALEQEELDDRLAGAERAPVHAPISPIGQTSGREREYTVLL
jgi:charged multivesicular body protein 4